MMPNYSNGSTVTICECDHLTNFAILISPSPDVLDGSNAVVLSIISTVCCIISIVALVLNIVIYAMRWKKLRSHHAVVLINLCIALIIADIIFLAGVDRTDPKVGCQLVAVLLHYFFLASFFLMLAEAIQLLLYTVFIFHIRRKRETAAIITTAWVIPAIIVAISLGITKTVGYGDSGLSCWLPPGRGVFWAFAGPALCIIVVNFVIMIVVLCRVSRIRRPSEKDGTKERLRAALWNAMVIGPVLGVTWVFGVFAFNNNLVVFQYIFAISNSLQGLLIFIFHGLCKDRSVRERYSVRGRASKLQQQQQHRSESSQSQVVTSLQAPPQKPSWWNRQSSKRPPTVTTDTDDVIVIIGPEGSEMEGERRRPSQMTIDETESSVDFYGGKQKKKMSVSSGISSASTSSASSSSSTSSSTSSAGGYSHGTATTYLTNSATEDSTESSTPSRHHHHQQQPKRKKNRDQSYL